MSTHPQSFSATSTPVGIRPYSSRKKCASLTEARKSASVRGSRSFSSCDSKPTMDFLSVYDAYRRRIYSQCFYMLRNHGDAEDAAQEVFLQLFKKVQAFRGESKFSRTWLHRLTTNCVLMEMRKKRRPLARNQPRRIHPWHFTTRMTASIRLWIISVHPAQPSSTKSISRQWLRNCRWAFKRYSKCTTSKGIHTRKSPHLCKYKSARQNHNCIRRATACADCLKTAG